MKKKRVKIKDQIYNGLFTNTELTQSSKNALINSGFIIIAALWIGNNIEKK